MVIFKLIRQFCSTLVRKGWLFLPLLLTACLPVKEPVSSQLQGSGTIVVEMSGFHNDQGVARALLFPSPEGFPDDFNKALLNLQAEIRDGRAEITFSGVPLGFYAISVLHDENSDNRMATSLLGFPEEGFGVSNGVGSRFGPPDFKEARIILLIDRLQVPVKVEYLEEIRSERRRKRRQD